MGSKPKARKLENTSTTTTNNNNKVIGKGKVTPVQVAFIVDRYLADNNFTQTRSSFRDEASSLISKSSPVQVPKSLMSLGELLDEYIWLKEQKVLIEHGKCCLAQENCRIQTLLQGMQGVMNDYNSASATDSTNCLMAPSPLVLPSIPAPPTSMHTSSSTGYPASRTWIMTSGSNSRIMKTDHANFTTPISGGRPPWKRRKNYKDLENATQALKKVYCGPLANYPFPSKVSNAAGQSSNTCSSDESPAFQSFSPNFVQGGLPIQGSSVVKTLFDYPSHSPAVNSSIPKTPPRAISSPSDKSISQEDVSSTVISHNTTNPSETTPTNCTIISKTTIVSPGKRYSVERNKCKFSSPGKSNFKPQNSRDHVKGRLDFDSSDVPSREESTTSESEKEGDIFELDLPNFDVFGSDFSLTELLTDFGIDCENIDYSRPTTASNSADGVPDSAHERNNGESGTSQDLIEHSSAVTEIVTAENTVNGSESVTSMKSVTKCIRIVSPAKYSRNSAADQENPCEKANLEC